jgi:hypothetical protein
MKTCAWGMFIFFMSQNVFAATTVDSTYVSPSAVTTKIECTRFNFNGTNTNSVPADSYGAFNPATCVNGFGGFVTFVAMQTPAAPGNNLGVFCPFDHPYMYSTSESWLLGGGNGFASSGVLCCEAPSNSVSGSSAWEDPVSGACS